MKRLVTERTNPTFNQNICYDRQLVFFGTTNKVTVFVKHNKKVYVSFNICRNYLWRQKSLKRYGLEYLDQLYPNVLKYRNRFRNKELDPLYSKKLWGLAKQAKKLNPKNWVFYQDPVSGNIYEVFPDTSRSYNCWFVKNWFIF